MKRLLGIIIGLFLIGCEDTRVQECDECVLDIYSSNMEVSDEGVYLLEYNQDLTQTYTMLEATTECGWSQHLQWDTDYQYLINTGWVSLVNPASMTDEDGVGRIIFGTWRDFIGYTIGVYGGYMDECNNHHVDSIFIRVN